MGTDRCSVTSIPHGKRSVIPGPWRASTATCSRCFLAERRVSPKKKNGRRRSELRADSSPTPGGRPAALDLVRTRRCQGRRRAETSLAGFDIRLGDVPDDDAGRAGRPAAQSLYRVDRHDRRISDRLQLIRGGNPRTDGWILASAMHFSADNRPAWRRVAVVMDMVVAPMGAEAIGSGEAVLSHPSGHALTRQPSAFRGTRRSVLSHPYLAAKGAYLNLLCSWLLRHEGWARIVRERTESGDPSEPMKKQSGKRGAPHRRSGR